MSKGFKRSKSTAFSDIFPDPPAPVVKEKPKPTRKSQDLERTQSQILVEDTPVKPIKHFNGNRPPVPLATTVARVNRSSSRASSPRKSSLPLELSEEKSSVAHTPVKSGLQQHPDLVGDEEDDDDEWMIGSPSVRRSLASALADEDARSCSP